MTTHGSQTRSIRGAFAGGAAIGLLGGLIGLGGAEFRLPLLMSAFHFAALEAIILNKAISVVVVAAALPFRAGVIPFDTITAHWAIVLNLLAGSLLGAWVGAGWAMRLSSPSLHRVIAVLLVVIAAVLLVGHDLPSVAPGMSAPVQAAAGVVAGFLIGVVASVLGVAGGELLIPAIVLLFGTDLKLAGSLSLAVSLPTMIVGFSRYAGDRSFAVLGGNSRFAVAMAVGSVFGAFLGGQLLGVIPVAVLLPLLAAILLASAIKMWRHAQQKTSSLSSVRGAHLKTGGG